MGNPGVSSSSNANTQAITNGMQLLFVLRNASFNITSDQQFTKVFNGTTWDPQFIIANQVSGASGGSPAGGIFSAPSKGGSAIVATGQSWTGLTGAATHVNATVQATGVTFTSVPYFSLTTASTAVLNADLFIYGFSYD